MATLLHITIPDPQNVLDTFGALAKYRIERDTVSTMATAAEIATGTVIAATVEYEYPDGTGTPGTHWYRVRYSTASPTLSTHYSGFGPVFQGGAPGGEVVTLEGYKNWAGISDTTDDAWLTVTIGAMNRAAIGGIGVDLGPSPDTTRTYDAWDAVDGGRRLWIPGGIRAFTTVETSSDGTTFSAITTSMRVGPPVHERAPGEPGAYIEYIPSSVSNLAGMYSVRITGTAFATFGWDAYPEDLTQACLVGIQRASAERRGMGNFPTETDVARYLNKAVLDKYRTGYQRSLVA